MLSQEMRAAVGHRNARTQKLRGSNLEKNSSIPRQHFLFLRMPGVSRQGQAHIVSTAILSPRSRNAIREVEATP